MTIFVFNPIIHIVHLDGRWTFLILALPAKPPGTASRKNVGLVIFSMSGNYTFEALDFADSRIPFSSSKVAPLSSSVCRRKLLQN